MQTVMRRRVIFFAFEGTQALDLVGPMDVFDAAGRVAGRTHARNVAYDIEVCAPQAGSITLSNGLCIAAPRALGELRGPIDTLVVTGGYGTNAMLADEQSIRTLARVAGRARRVASVCTGAYLLAATGLLDGRRATTHWAWCDVLQQGRPGVRVEPDAIYVRDGHVWSSAGVTAGIDLALALVEEDLGQRVSLLVARQLVLYVRRPGGKSQFSAQLSAQIAENDAIRELQTWIAEHVREELSVARLARRVHMSPRNFARVFRREVGVTPAVYVERARIEVARTLLETTRRSIDEIASRCGFGSTQTLRRAFARRVGVSPAEYRERFAPASARAADAAGS